MPNPCQDIQGVRSVDFTLAQELEIEATIEESEPLLDRLGDFVCAETYGSRNNFTIEGKGDVPDGVAAGGSVTIAGLTTGQTFVKSVRQSQKGGDWFSWTVSGTNYPFAVAPV
jgi:hypothetical protein